MSDVPEQKEDCPECGEIYDPFASGMLDLTLKSPKAHERQIDAEHYERICISRQSFSHEQTDGVWMYVHQMEPEPTDENEHQIEGVLE